MIWAMVSVFGQLASSGCKIEWFGYYVVVKSGL